jgi:putative endonuclease
MRGQKTYYVYILTNKSGTLYTGMTGDLKSRLWHHRNKTADGFTRRYSIDKLLYYECFSDAYSAIAREKAIKG